VPRLPDGSFTLIGDKRRATQMTQSGENRIEPNFPVLSIKADIAASLPLPPRPPQRTAPSRRGGPHASPLSIIAVAEVGVVLPSAEGVLKLDSIT
jgi:hypothetical protein